MRNEIHFTDDEIEAHFDEQNIIGGCYDELVFTRETLDDYRTSRDGWAEAGHVETDTLGGLPALIFEDFQVEKGQRRKSAVVIDYGSVRAVLNS